MIENTYISLVRQIQENFKQLGNKKLVIGSSGGLDSAVVVALCTIAVGNENVMTINLPYHYNSAQTIENAESIAKFWDVQFLKVAITPIMHEITTLKSKDEDNAQARVRGMLLQHYASTNDGVCVACVNKSELTVGYITYMGADMVGAFCPLGDLWKRDVVELAMYINKTHNKEVDGYHNYAIPPNLLPNEDWEWETYPSAELKVDNPDPFNYEVDDILLANITKAERPLTYEECDKLAKMLPRFNEYYKTVHEICDKASQLFRLMTNNAWKRSRLPPILTRS